MSTTTYVYDVTATVNSKDSPITVTDPMGAISRYVYNTLGLTSQATAPNGHVTQFGYVMTGTYSGKVSSIAEVAVPAWDSTLRKELDVNQTTGFTFNALGNDTAEATPQGRRRRFVRDVKQRVTDFYDQAGHRTEYVYDEFNRVTQTKQHVEQAGNPGYPADPDFAAPLVTTNHYDVDVMDQVTDPRGVIRRYQYDLAGRGIGETDDYGTNETRWLDNSSAVDSVRSRMGDVVSHRYDAAGRKTKTYWPLRQGTPGDSLLSNYDIMGRLTDAKISWPGPGSVTRTYYGTGAVRTDVASGPFAGHTVTQAYYYNQAGQRTAHRIGPVNDLVHSDSVTYSYDYPTTGTKTGELRQLTVRWRTVSGSSPNDFVRFRWDALGRRDTVAYSNGMIFAFGYDRDGTQRFLCTKQGVTVPAGGSGDVSIFRLVNDSVDSDGLIKRVNGAALGAPLGCAGGTPMSTATNTYDNRHQLKSQAGGAHSTTYRYDGSGNMIQTVRDGNTYLDTMDPAHNRLRRRQRTADYLLFSYTASGDRQDENPCLQTDCGTAINDGYRGHLYDGLGRSVGYNMKACFNGTCGVVPNSNCYYDPLSRMIVPCEDVAPNLGFDGENVVRTGTDNSPTDWTFIHGPATDDPVLGRYTGNNVVTYFVTDGQGRQYAALGVGGNDRTSTPEYGQSGGKYAGGTANGASFDADRHGSSDVPGLSFFRNRVYDQATGRWTQEDPIGVAGGLNLYQFNGNNPVTHTDPFGLQCCISAFEQLTVQMFAPMFNRLMSAITVRGQVQAGFTTASMQGDLAGGSGATVATAAQVPALSASAAVGLHVQDAPPGSKTVGVDIGKSTSTGIGVGVRITAAADATGVHVTDMEVYIGAGTPGPAVQPSIRDTDCNAGTQCSQK